jgi:hypothetical protein
LKVSTTNSTATATVTAWEKTSQLRRMEWGGRGWDGCSPSRGLRMAA